MENLSAEKRFILSLSDEQLRRLLALAAKNGRRGTPAAGEGFRFPPEVAERLKSIRGKRHLDRDDRLWAGYVEKLSRLRYSALPGADGQSDREFYRRMLDECEKRRMPSDFALELASSLLEYRSSGHTRPILLYGPPGCGKTRAGLFLAELLGRAEYLTSVPACEHRHGMLGEGSAYRSPDIGELWRGIFQAGTLNPVFILDEMDKTVEAPEHLSVADELLPILSDESMSFTDNFLDFPGSLYGSLLVFTCNDLDAVSEPLRDRCTLFAFHEVELERMEYIAADYAAKRLRACYRDSLIFKPEALRLGVRRLYNGGVRSIRQHQNLVDLTFKRAYGIYLSGEAGNVPVTEELYYETVERLRETARIARTAGFLG